MLPTPLISVRTSKPCSTYEMYEKLKPKFMEQVLELFPDDEALQTARYRNALETAKL